MVFYDVSNNISYIATTSEPIYAFPVCLYATTSAILLNSKAAF